MEEPPIKTENQKIIRLSHEPYRYFTYQQRQGGLSLKVSKTAPRLSIEKEKSVDVLGNRPFVSNLPEDYFNIYANTNATYSNRIHSTILSLAFNKQSRLFITNINTNRLKILERVDAKDVINKLMRLDAAKLGEKKEAHLIALKDIVRSS